MIFLGQIRPQHLRFVNNSRKCFQQLTVPMFRFICYVQKGRVSICKAFLLQIWGIKIIDNNWLLSVLYVDVTLGVPNRMFWIQIRSMPWFMCRRYFLVSSVSKMDTEALFPRSSSNRKPPQQLFRDNEKHAALIR